MHSSAGGVHRIKLIELSQSLVCALVAGFGKRIPFRLLVEAESCRDERSRTTEQKELHHDCGADRIQLRGYLERDHHERGLACSDARI